jgi:hypothetical protein
MAADVAHTSCRPCKTEVEAREYLEAQNYPNVTDVRSRSPGVWTGSVVLTGCRNVIGIDRDGAIGILRSRCDTK